MSKLISRFEIGFDNDTKATINDLNAKLDAVVHGLSAKNDTHADRLLAAMQADAANDAPQPELKQLGQWVFEGQDEKWQSGAVDKNGDGYLYSCDKSILRLCGHRTTHKGDFDTHLMPIGGNFDTTDWKNSAINRETVNDVDYLSGDLDECVPHIDDVLAQPNWLSESVPQITQADMQLIFIKNLSECLIQRMHSMDRFSEDDYAIGGNNLMAWDILIYEPLDLYAVLMRGPDQINVADLLLIRDGGPMADAGWNTTSEAFAILRTITEAELPAFRAALEACYA